MGAPHKNRKKFEKPRQIWNLERITSDNSIKKEYGLKNMKELWRAQSQVSRVRGNVRVLLSGSTQNPETERNILSSLSKLGVVPPNPTLDTILDLKNQAFLERRLQSIVFRKGLARSMRQARQLIAHGFIAINGMRVNRPGYMVSTEEENAISYYKQIDITPPKQAAPVAQHGDPALAEESAPAQGPEPAKEAPAPTEAAAPTGSADNNRS